MSRKSLSMEISYLKQQRPIIMNYETWNAIIDVLETIHEQLEDIEQRLSELEYKG